MIDDDGTVSNGDTTTLIQSRCMNGTVVEQEHILVMITTQASGKYLK